MVGVSIYNNGPRSIYLRGCPTLVVEAVEGGVWVEQHLHRCAEEGGACVIAPLASRKFEVAAPRADRPGRRYRVRVPYWVSCRQASPGRPIARMDCEGPREITSAEFEVASR